MQRAVQAGFEAFWLWGSRLKNILFKPVSWSVRHAVYREYGYTSLLLGRLYRVLAKGGQNAMVKSEARARFFGTRRNADCDMKDRCRVLCFGGCAKTIVFSHA